MLVLGRKPGEKVVIGNGVTITVLAVKGQKVRLAVQAPDDVLILRSELAFSQDDVDEAEMQASRVFAQRHRYQ